MQADAQTTQKLLEQSDRTKSLSSIYAGASGLRKMPVPASAKGLNVKGKPGEISAESVQKSAFYS